MPRPKPRPALSSPRLPKAPSRDHPVAPPAAALPEPARPAAAVRMFSVRLDPALVRRVKLYAAAAEVSLQALTEAALITYMSAHPDPSAAYVNLHVGM